MRYKRELILNFAERWSSPPWSSYRQSVDDHDVGHVVTPIGLISVARFPDRGVIRFVLNGRYKVYAVRPCPTRRGLVGMARRVIRQLSQQNGKASR